MTGTRRRLISRRFTALLGTDAGVRAGRVDQRDDGQPELLGELHLEERLAVALRVRAAEVARQAFLGVTALLVADDEALDAPDAPEAGHDRRVVAVAAVAVQLAPVAADHLNVVEGLRALRVARHAHGLPRREAAVGLGQQAAARLVQRADLVGNGGRVGAALERRDLALDLGDGLLEVEDLDCGHQANRSRGGGR
jgi:hypothetical protein